MTRLAILPLLFLTAALPPEARTALERLDARYSRGAAHVASFTQTYTAAGFTTARSESGTVWIQKPQLLRFEYQKPEKKIFTFDSEEARFYAPDDKQLTTQRLSAQDRARLPILFLTDPAGLTRDYDLSVEAPQSGGTRLLLKPRAARPELAWLRLTISSDGTVPQLSYEDASGNRTEFRFEGWRAEKTRPAGDYRMVGPPGTRVVEN